MSTPKKGATDICIQCNESILYNGSGWQHTNGPKRHLIARYTFALQQRVKVSNPLPDEGIQGHHQYRNEIGTVTQRRFEKGREEYSVTLEDYKVVWFHYLELSAMPDAKPKRKPRVEPA